MMRTAWLSAVVALGLVAIVLIIRWSRRRYTLRQIKGRLLFDSNAVSTASYPVGAFIITWDPENGGRLSIHHQAKPDKVLWASLPGRSFLAAALGAETVKGARGFFTFKDELQTICADQIITAFILDAKASTLTVVGTLSCRRGHDTVDYQLTFVARSTNQLTFEFTLADERYNRTYLTYASDRNEHFYGFGMQFTYFDVKGQRLPIVSTEQGVGRGAQPITLGANLAAGAGGTWYTTYAGVPHYMTSRMRSLFLTTYEYAVFDLRQVDRAQIQLWAPRMAGRILHGESPAQLIKEYTAYAGRMRPLPNWILEGAIVGMQGGTDKVRRILAKLQEAETPISALWLEDWVGQRVTSFGKQLWWNWELDKDHYPGWDALVDELHQQGIRMMVYVNCHLADAAGKSNHRRNLFAEAAAHGYLVKNRFGEPHLIQNSDFSGGMLDLTNPHAQRWMKAVLHQQVIGIGASGWMADYGEALPYDAVLWSGEPASSYHNRYPEAWAALNRETIDDTGRGKELVFFSRSAYRHSPSHSTLFWLGDQLVSWDHFDGIKTAVTGLLSSGLSGFSLNHSDIGGHTGNTNAIRSYHRTRELLLRWTELNAFTTIFRTHEGNTPDANHQFYSDEESLAHFIRFAKVYNAWSFYRKQLVREAAQTGLPVVRHLLVHYPSDPNVYDLWYQQFMVGSEFMVAPVLDPNTDKVAAYLPAGRWVHLWSSDSYGPEAGRVTVHAPLGQPAVFYREDSPVACRFLANLDAAGILEPSERTA